MGLPGWLSTRGLMSCVKSSRGAERAQAGDRRRSVGAVGALADVFPCAREQRCWVHKQRTYWTRCPSAYTRWPGGCSTDIEHAPTRKEAERTSDQFVAEFEPKWPKATNKIVKDREPLLACYDFPAEHWRHLRTTNPIESTFATVRLRTRVTKGAGSKDAALAMAYKLLDAARLAGEYSTAPNSSRTYSTARHSKTGSRSRTTTTTTTRRRTRGSPPDDPHPLIHNI